MISQPLNEDCYLIRVVASGRERIQNSNYYFVNRDRPNSEYNVIQRTLSGSCVFEYEGRQTIVHPGQLMLFTHQDNSRYWYPENANESYKCEWIVLVGGSTSGFFQAIRKEIGSVIDLPETSIALNLFNELLDTTLAQQEYDRFNTASVAHSLLISLLQHSSEKESDTSPEQKAYHLIQNSFCTPTNLKEIAAKIGCTREHLTRRFVARYGEAPASLLRQRRLELAKELLECTNLDLFEISRKCGYQNLNTFLIAFKREILCSPGEYRSARTLRS